MHKKLGLILTSFVLFTSLNAFSDPVLRAHISFNPDWFILETDHPSISLPQHPLEHRFIRSDFEDGIPRPDFFSVRSSDIWRSMPVSLTGLFSIQGTSDHPYTTHVFQMVRANQRYKIPQTGSFAMAYILPEQTQPLVINVQIASRDLVSQVYFRLDEQQKNQLEEKQINQSPSSSCAEEILLRRNQSTQEQAPGAISDFGI